MHISLDSALGQQRRLNSVGESITQIAPDPAAAYSLRSLTGGDPKVVRVRRSSDDGEQDFTASEINSGALVAYVGSGNDGFVETWYDQSGNGNDAVQATAAEQPKIVDAGSLIVDGQSKASIKFTTSDTTSLVADNVAATQAYSAIFKANAEKSSTSQQVIDGDTSTTSFIQIGNDGVIDINNGTTVATSADLDSLSSDFVFTAIINGSSSNAFFNGSNVAENQNVGSNNLVGLTMGKHRSSSANYYDNQLSEIIIYASDQSSKRTALEANIISHYGIS